jgi:outer membrane protein assembly factor BamE (lipoprotein component of BamABCDE complex)
MGTIKLVTAFLLALTVGFTGCASSSSSAAGLHQDPKTLQQLHINKSTKEEIKKLLGEPQSVTIFSNHSEQWLYESVETDYTEVYVAKKALAFVPVPHLGTVVGLADMGPEKIKDIHTLSLQFSKNGILEQIKKETKQQ